MPAVVRARLCSDVRLDPRPEYVRVVLGWEAGQAVAKTLPTGNQISSRLLSCSAANGLLMLPPRSEEVKEMKAGTEVDAMVIGKLSRDWM